MLPDDTAALDAGEQIDPAAEAAPEIEIPEPEKDETNLVKKFEELVKVPSNLKQWYELFDKDREYVNETCMLMDDDDVVATNYIFRNQQVQLANIYAKDPDISFAPRQMMGVTPPAPPMPMGMPPPMPGAPPMGMPLPPPPIDTGLPPGLTDYGRTLELLVKQFADEGGFRRVLMGAVQDAMTVGWSWIKLSQQEDIKRDPLGNRRQNDQQDNFARCQWLKKRFVAEEFTEDSAEFKELKDCEEVVAAYMKADLEKQMAEAPLQGQPMIDPMTGMPAMDPITGAPQMSPPPMDPRQAHLEMLNSGQIPDELLLDPEISRYVGFNFDSVQPEDIRFDWSITRPEDIYSGEWFAHRVFMNRDAIGSKWQIDPEIMKKIKLFDSCGDSTSRHWTQDPAGRSNIENAEINDRCAVWEFWDKRTGKVYVWADGMDRFLDEYIPNIVWHGWFPFFPIYFNRVTGRVIPLSDTLLVKHLQDEINLLRTHDREARKAALPRFLMKAGVMEPQERAEFEENHPFRVHEVQEPDEILKAFATIVGAPYNPQLYDTIKAVMEMEQLSGVSRQAAGLPGGADTATESAVANEQFGMQSDLRKFAIETVIHDILYAVAEMSAQFVPEENVKKICGEGAFWPMFDRETLFRYLHLNVRAGSSGKPDASKTLKLWTEFANIAGSLGLQVNGPEVLKEVLRAMDVNIDLNKFIIPQIPGMMPPMPPGGGGGGPIPGPVGAPPQGTGGPRPPDQIPNHPQI